MRLGESAGPREGPVSALEAMGGYGESLRRGVAHLSSEGRVPELHLTLWRSFFHWELTWSEPREWLCGLRPVVLNADSCGHLCR